MKDEYRGEYTRCRYHPKQEVIGVCHLCLHHRLLLLAAAAKHDAYSSSSSSSGSSSWRRQQMLSGISLPKLFALQLPSLDSYKRPRPHPDDLLTTSSTLQDESFISIKFGDNGEASWDKSKKSTKRKQQQQRQDCSTTRTPWGYGYRWGKSVVEHGKPRPASLRWRKRISQLIQVIRGKKPAARRHC